MTPFGVRILGVDLVCLFLKLSRHVLKDRGIYLATCAFGEIAAIEGAVSEALTGIGHGNPALSGSLCSDP